MYSSQCRASFTLIELLIVIAIIAVLATVVILALNPAQLLMQARDANRVSDLADMQQALSLYAVGQGGFPLATPGVTYVSLPDPTATTTAGTDCSGLGGYFAGGNYHCAASSTYRNVDGTGWLPVDFKTMAGGSPFGALPVDPVNTTSSGEYYTFQTDGTTFKLTAVPESEKYLAEAGANPNMFQVGNNLNLDGGKYWVLIPGNQTFGTQNFWVMKYDAVCSNGEGTYINDNNSGYDTYSNSGEPCTSANGRQIASLPGGWPITNITQTTAVSYCQSIGAHLLTNDEWMTINTNAAEQGANWSGGTPGSGYMYSGHNDNAPAEALPASSEDANGYYGETNTGGNQRRTYTLSNGTVIWDMAGNVWQRVQRSVMNQGDLTTTMAVPAVSGGGGWAWYEYTSISSWTADVSEAETAPPNSSWNSTQGMGLICTYGAGGNQNVTTFDRGGAWGSGARAGPFGMTLYCNTSYGQVFGFRCAR